MYLRDGSAQTICCHTEVEAADQTFYLTHDDIYDNNNDDDTNNITKKNSDNNVKISYPDPDTIIMMKTMIIRPCACMQIFF